jgi:hypothetical protein
MTTNPNELDGNTERMRTETLRLLLAKLKPVRQTEDGQPLFAIEDVAEAIGLPVEVCEAALERGRQGRTVH